MSVTPPSYRSGMEFVRRRSWVWSWSGCSSCSCSPAARTSAAWRVVGRRRPRRTAGRAARAHATGDARPPSGDAAPRSCAAPRPRIDHQVGRDARGAGPPQPAGRGDRARPARARGRAHQPAARAAGRQTQVLGRDHAVAARGALEHHRARASGANAWPKTSCGSPASSTASTTGATSPLPGVGRHPRLHVPAPAGPDPAHGREVPAQQLPAHHRRHLRRRARARRARSS